MLLMELFPDPDFPINNTFFFFCLRGSVEGDATGSSWTLRLLIWSILEAGGSKGEREDRVATPENDGGELLEESLSFEELYVRAVDPLSAG